MKISRKKLICSAMITVILLGFISLSIYLKSVFDYKQAVKNIRITEADFSVISDGTYIGECNVNFISAKVEVAIENGKILNITILEHKNDRGENAEVVIDRIVDEQKIDVDAVSGATNSSLVLKKAVENALSS